MPVYELGSIKKKKPTLIRDTGQNRPVGVGDINQNTFKPTLSDIALKGGVSSTGTNTITPTSAVKPKTTPVSSSTAGKDTTSEYIYTRKNGNGDVSSTPTGGEQFWNKIKNPNYKAPVDNASELGSYTANQAYADSKLAMDEAKAKTEASKASALGYFDPLEADANKLYNTDVISADQEQQALNKKRNDLAVSGQNLLGAFGDADSGIQSGVRRNIALNTANQAANLPIQTQLEIAVANRDAKINALGQRYNIAGQKAGIETAYDYDPGLDYISQLGEALGTETPEKTEKQISDEADEKYKKMKEALDKIKSDRKKDLFWNPTPFGYGY
jgi:hypothetical protein